MKRLTFSHRVRLTLISLIACSLIVVGLAIAQQTNQATEPDSAVPAPPYEASYDSATFQGLAPDENNTADAAHPLAPTATFHYYLVSGATLNGRSSATEYVYDGSGCAHVTTGTGTGRILNTELNLPDGATIKYLRVYYKDSNPASGVEGYITRYQPGMATLDLVHTGSTDAFNGGYGYTVSTEITETVNNTAYAYTLIGWPDDIGVNNQICGLRVAYYAPTTAVYLPAVQRP